MSLEQRISRAWYGSPGWLCLLLPLEGLFRLVAWLRRRCIRPQSCGVPVVVIGNISVGGSGKTPVVLAVAGYLRDRGLRPGIVSRGYGGKADHYPLLVDADTPVTQSGDEPALMARRSGLPVAVAPDRLAAARLLVDQYQCNVIISDDGLQHYRLARQVEVLVVDGQRGLGNGHCLPVGPLREPVARARQVELRVVNGSGAMAPDLVGFGMQLRGRELINIGSGERRNIADWPAAQCEVNALAGIGNPARFFNSLRQLGFVVNERPLPDHHEITPADLQFARTLPLLMTEKDAVKCAGFAGENCWMLPVDAEIDGAFFSRILQRLNLDGAIPIGE